MIKKTMHEKSVEAETKAAMYLGNANEAAEQGCKSQHLYDLAQKWLDIANKFKGQGSI